VRGRLVHEAADPSLLPVIGDRVRCFMGSADSNSAIEEVLPRRSLLVRVAAGSVGIQALAANVDYVLITSSLNQDLNYNRLDRYLTMAFDSGAQPVVVLTKKDLNPDWQKTLHECRAHAKGVTVLAVSADQDESWLPLADYVSRDKVAVLVGSSGVGKSTLINRLLGYEALNTGGIRKDDDKGRHTTTARSMWRSQAQGWIIDTPGMRELQLLDNEEGLSLAFPDIEGLFLNCRFQDCGHQSEPSCAVKEALQSGALAVERWESYGKLQREIELQKRKSERASRGRLPRRR